MSRSRRNRLLELIARVDAARVAIVDRHKTTREFFAAGELVVRELILPGRRQRLLRAYLDDTRPRRAPR